MASGFSDIQNTLDEIRLDKNGKPRKWPYILLSVFLVLAIVGAVTSFVSIPKEITADCDVCQPWPFTSVPVYSQPDTTSQIVEYARERGIHLNTDYLTVSEVVQKDGQTWYKIKMFDLETEPEGYVLASQVISRESYAFRVSLIAVAIFGFALTFSYFYWRHKRLQKAA